MSKLKFIFISLCLCLTMSLQAQNNVRRAEQYLVSAVSLIDAGDFASASKYLDLAGMIDPSNDAVLYYKALLDYSNDNLQGALQKMKAAYSIDPSNMVYAKYLYSFYNYVGEPEEGIKLCKLVNAANPYDTDVLVDLADMYSDAHDFERSDSLLNVVEIMDGISDRIRIKRISNMDGRGDLDATLTMIDEFIDVSEMPGAVKVNIIEYPMKKYGVESFVDNVGRYESMVDKCLAKYPADTAVTHFASRFYYLSRSSEKVSKLSDSYPGDVTLATIGMLDGIASSDLDYALKMCDRIIEATDDAAIKSETYCNKGDFYQALGVVDEAVDSYIKALEHNPDNINAINNYSYMMAEMDMNLDQCASLMRRVISIEGNNPTYLDTYGWILYKQGRYSQAKAVFMKSFLYGGKKLKEVVLHYAAVLEKLGDTRQAAEYRALAETLEN